MIHEIPDPDPDLTAMGARWRKKLSEARASGDIVGIRKAEQQIMLIGVVAQSRAAKCQTQSLRAR